MVKIRLKRTGRNAYSTYRIVVSDSRRTPRAEALADLGHFNPNTDELVINEEEAMKWLRNGAEPSDTVRVLLRKKGLTKKLAEEKAKKESK
ncbi:MAG: 30S ribosomal protein S16 [Bacilli bacterium]|jgi:small subunit ribosomal protein S16|nr:30S ribosomal protein S16 [Bacilli bacterium]